MKEEQLLSVGIDIGTTTTQLVFSRLTVKNAASEFTVPRFSITEKEILYRSAIHFTPLLSDSVIDAEGVRCIAEKEYALSGFRPQDIQTGAVIITGETARKENAREVLSALSGFAGDFVVATAGPKLESILAGKGSGAQKYSEKKNCDVLNLDIGGGTTNMALFSKGKLKDTGCLNVGGRLLKFDEEGALRYISPVLRPYFDLEVGIRPQEKQLWEVAEFLVDILESALQGEAVPEGFVTDKLPKLDGEPILSFSGGVADLICEESHPLLSFGDLGVVLGKAIFRSALCRRNFLRAEETIRATVIGAGSHSTELSGSTVFYEGVNFPLKNLPVVQMDAEEEALPAEALARKVREKLSLFPSDGEPAVLGLRGKENPKFAELCKLADGLALGLRLRQTNPVIIAVEADMGKSLGQALRMLLPEQSLLCLDGLRLSEGSYLDIGAPIAGGQVLPVVIKTLAIG